MILCFLNNLKKIIFLFFVSMILMLSCKKYDILGMFTAVSESPDERFAMSMEYNNAHGYDKIFVGDDNYRLYVMTDVHLDNSTKNLDKYVTDYLRDTTAAQFSLCLGDLIYGKDKFDYFCEHVKPVDDAGRKIYHTVGNHDLYFNQWKDFLKRFNTSTYWFEVQTVSGFKDLYISIDSGNGTLGVDQRRWLENLLKNKQNQGFRNIIIFTHTHFFRTSNVLEHTSSFNMEETYDLADLFARYGVTMVLQGHSHYRDLRVFKGVKYLRLDAMKDDMPEAYYTVLEVGEEIVARFKLI